MVMYGSTLTMIKNVNNKPNFLSAITLLFSRLARAVRFIVRDSLKMPVLDFPLAFPSST